MPRDERRRAKRVLLRADASAAIGAGHLIRCLALGRALAAHAEVVLATTCGEPALLEHVGQAGFKILRIEASHPDSHDASQIIDAFAGAEPLGVVIDGYQFDEAYVSLLRAAGLRTLMIDDQPRLNEYDCDLLLDQNPGAEMQSYRVGAKTVVLLGPRFALLRPQFLAIPRKTGSAPPVAERLLVSMGASDPANSTSLVLHALAAAPLSFELTVVVGGANRFGADVEAAASRFDRIRVLRNPVDLERLMSEADMAIAAVGGTIWELAYVGVPTLLLSGAAVHHRIAGLVDREGTHRWIGPIATVDEQTISDAVVSLARDRFAREKMTALAQALIDGQGGRRVATAMCDLNTPLPAGAVSRSGDLS